MTHFFKSSLLGSFYLAFFSLFTDFQELSAYVDVPRSTADTTNRMNHGGDPAERPGLIDAQRSPEYLDDWWGQNDYYYSYYGRQINRGDIYNPVYNQSFRPPYYSLPNSYYQDDRRYYEYDGNYYRSSMPK